jgi:hypothetical protein
MKNAFRLLAAVTIVMGLATAARADVSVSQSNDPTGAVGPGVAAMLGAERSVLSALPAFRARAIAEGRPLRVGRPERLDAEWLMTQPAPAGDRQWECLAQAIYFEARGEDLRGQFAVAEVILNRVDSALYPGSICEVVHQGAKRLNACQFSFACDGKPERIADKAAYATAGRIARLMLDGEARTLTDGATHFHARYVRPGWARRFEQTARIGTHLFYRPGPGSS